VKNKVWGVGFIFFCIGLWAYVDHANYMSAQWNLVGEDSFEIEKGESPKEVIRRLKKKIEFGNEERLFRYAQFYGYTSRIRYGRIQISKPVTFHSLFKQLSKAQAAQISVQHIEGKNIYDFSRVLEKSGIATFSEALKFLKDKGNITRILGSGFNSFEGYLYPDTYSFNKNPTLDKVISTMVSRFNEVYKKLPSHTLKLNAHQIVTLASIIEKETGAGFERAMISSVFHNRMKKGMRLETDPTVMYGILHKTNREITNIRRKHLKDNNPYNTYLIPSLPPGPIASPGKEALVAALQPEKTEYLFFVSKNNGTHQFTTNYSDHLKAVKGYQLNPKAREGKSWRDLKKAADEK